MKRTCAHESLVEMAIFNVQRAITPKVGKPELRVMSSARRLIVLYICEKFRENISDGIRVMERTLMKEALTDGRTLKISEGITKCPRHFLLWGIKIVLNFYICSTFQDVIQMIGDKKYFTIQNPKVQLTLVIST